MLVEPAPMLAESAAVPPEPDADGTKEVGGARPLGSPIGPRRCLAQQEKRMEEPGPWGASLAPVVPGSAGKRLEEPGPWGAPLAPGVPGSAGDEVGGGWRKLAWPLGSPIGPSGALAAWWASTTTATGGTCHLMVPTTTGGIRVRHDPAHCMRMCIVERTGDVGDGSRRTP